MVIHGRSGPALEDSLWAGVDEGHSAAGVTASLVFGRGFGGGGFFAARGPVAAARGWRAVAVAPVSTTVAAAVAASIASFAPVAVAAIAAAVPAAVPAAVAEAALLAGLDRLRLDGVHLRFVEVIGLGDQHAEHVLAEVDLALDRRDGGAGRAEVRDD